MLFKKLIYFWKAIPKQNKKDFRDITILLCFVWIILPAKETIIGTLLFVGFLFLSEKLWPSKEN